MRENRSLFQVAWCLLLGIAVLLPSVLTGCGDSDDKPVNVAPEQNKKAQAYLGSMRDQMVAAAKEKAKGKTHAKEAAKPAPETVKPAPEAEKPAP
jgi:hypothetical protein